MKKFHNQSTKVEKSLNDMENPKSTIGPSFIDNEKIIRKSLESEGGIWDFKNSTLNSPEQASPNSISVSCSRPILPINRKEISKENYFPFQLDEKFFYSKMKNSMLYTKFMQK